MQLESKPFAACGACARAWRAWDEFVHDPELRLLGFQGVLRVPDANLLVFEHRCGSTVSILTSRLRHLLPARPAADRQSLRGTIECPGNCLSLADLEACHEPCSNARDRELIGLLRELRRAGSPRQDPPAGQP